MVNGRHSDPLNVCCLGFRVPLGIFHFQLEKNVIALLTVFAGALIFLLCAGGLFGLIYLGLGYTPARMLDNRRQEFDNALRLNLLWELAHFK